MQKIFILPPPNVTGNLHIGHALNITIQDIKARWYRSKGNEVIWIPGTDHAGIATQLIAERALKEEGKTKNDLSEEDFLRYIWSVKEKFEPKIKEQISLMNTIINWDYYCFTLDSMSNKAVKTAFKKLYDKGLIFRQKRFVYWDTSLQTACSDLEVDFKVVKGNFYHINYDVVDENDNIVDKICVATTRPETLFGDVALCLHPDHPNAGRYVGKYAIVPFVKRKIPIISDQACELEKGTGVLKITPAHDMLDYEIGLRHNLEAISVINKEGLLCNVPEQFLGLSVKEAKKQVAKVLEELGLLEKIETIDHSVPHGEKSGCELEYISTLQWFVDMKPLAEKALKAVKEGKIDFIPENFINIYNQWLEKIEPWCISRQIAWGHKIPVWYYKDQTFVGSKEEVIQELKDQGTDQGKDQGKDQLFDINMDELIPEKDVLDTWFSSALWPLSTQNWPDQDQYIVKSYATDFLVTGKDILFFWVARMIMMSIELCDVLPFKQVYLHGLVLDKQGKKMSKVVGNVIDPLDLIAKYNADVLRIALIKKAFPGRDIRFEESELELARNFLTKLRNALEFSQKKLTSTDYNAQLYQTLKNEKWSAWILNCCMQIEKDFDAYMKKWEFAQAYQLLEKFTRDDFCAWYLEVIKHIKEISIEKVLTYVTNAILRMLEPFAPGFVEEYKDYSKDKMLKIDEMIIDLGSEKVAQIQAYIEKARSILKMPDSPFCKNMYVENEFTDEDLMIMNKLSKADISYINNDIPMEGLIKYAFEQGYIMLQVNNQISMDAFINRLQKEIAEHENIAMQAKVRLDNDKFRSNAAEELILEMQERIVLHTTLKREKKALLDAATVI